MIRPDLTTDRWGLRFVAPQVESDYQHWRLLTALPFIRIGMIASQSRLEYTAVGSAVNLASRLCAQAGHGEILICPATAAVVERGAIWRERRLQVKGFNEPVPVMVEVSPQPAPAFTRDAQAAG